MKLLFLLFFITPSFISHAQDWEISIAPGGLSNYDNWGKDRKVHVKSYQYSFFAGAFKRMEYKSRTKQGNVHWSQGLGMSYSFHQVHWEYYKSNGHASPTGVSGYKAQMSVLGFEYVPFIFTFAKGLEIRSGILVGALGVTKANFPNNRVRKFSLQAIQRLSYDLKLKKLKISPFYQFSTGILREVTTAQISPLTLFRHNIGVTIGLGGKKF